MEKTIFVDNSSHCFFLNHENGVPIIPFYGSLGDNELPSLQKFLELVYAEKDYRKFIGEYFNFKKLALLGDPMKAVNLIGQELQRPSPKFR